MRTTVLLALACGLWLAGCAGPSYKTEYYTLAADEHADAQGAAADVGTLGVGPIRLPEMLDVVGIVSWDDSQRVYIAPYAVWAGDLKQAVTRVLADDLSAYLATDDVWPFPWDNRVRPDRQVTAVIEQFGGERGGEVTLQAKWRLMNSDGNRVLDSGKVTLSTQADESSYNAYVAALNELLHQFAKSIAQAVKEQ